MPDKASALSQLILQIFQANGHIIHWGDQFAAVDDLTSARWQMLGAIALADSPQTSPQIAKRMGMTRQGAQKQLNLLLEDGLIRASENAAHKRSPHYLLTDKGQKTYAHIDGRWNEQAGQWASDFSQAELLNARHVIERLISIVDRSS